MRCRRAFILLFSTVIPIQADKDGTKWTPIAPANKDAILTLQFALHAADPTAMDHALSDVADIRSRSYGKYLRDDQIAELVRPSHGGLTAVEGFLRGCNITKSTHGDYVRVYLPVSTAASLFDADMYVFQHSIQTKRQVIRPRGLRFSLPDDLRRHVRLVDGLEHFPSTFQRQEHSRQLLATSSITSIRDIRRAYELPNDHDVSDPRNGIVVGAFLDETFNAQDVATYLKSGVPATEFYNAMPSQPIPLGLHCSSGRGTGEASLDAQLVAGLTQSSFASVHCYNHNRDSSRPFSDGNQEPFLAFMQDVNSMTPPPSVVSISYADDECAMPREYMEAVDYEFKKAGLRGTTIVASSGDNGVVGSPLLSYCGSPVCSVYQPQYPASSPYVLSVGATTLSNEALSVRNGGAITTGAGFSNYVNRSGVFDFQSSFVNPLVQAMPSAITSNAPFNAFGRAYPDVVAIGTGVGVVVQGGVELTDGTSVSAPVVASIVAHINKWRLDHGKPPLGYVVPYLYQLYAVCPSIFGDITQGSNACGSTSQPCCPSGFIAAKGYDILTGLGTIKYQSFVDQMDRCEALLRPSRATIVEDVTLELLNDRPIKSLLLAGAAVAMVVALVMSVALWLYQNNAVEMHYTVIH
ncbi:polynucleotide 3'-phosphatase [Aphanomyces cochlioides]|nr:polynucleotide 3'-phosphatase [Aphanomyces cochlioides]